MPRFDNLRDWLGWQETLHPDPIDLGLERVGEVAGRLGLLHPAAGVISVAGTNGKGSSVAMLDAVYRSAGYRTAVYTSPHLLAYNERICIGGRPVEDARLCAAFERIDAARNDISLTYFEFGTVAALEIFSTAQADIMILEIGMGGRLDAVNIIDADVALVTAIGLDHSQWLGNDRETIGREKAGIYRHGRPAICADPDPPASLQQAAVAAGADWLALGEHFSWQLQPAGWTWTGAGRSYHDLPVPALPGMHQFDNAAGVIMAVERLQSGYPVTAAAMADGLRSVSLAGRCQLIPGRVERVLDVAHNRESAHMLAAFLGNNPPAGKTWVVLGMLADKDVAGVVDELAPHADQWCFAALEGRRSLPAGEIVARSGMNQQARCFDSVEAAMEYVTRLAAAGDRLVVTGSFLAVAAALACRV